MINGRTLNVTRFATNLILVSLAALVLLGCGKREKPTVQANNLFLEAKKLIAAGDNVKALETLNQSIAVEPAMWAYHERAKLQAQMGNVEAALADCDAALKLEPDDADATWLRNELKKPAAERFKGKLKTPPSANR